MADAEPMAGRERPILFSGPMVRAILDGRKTQTRRVVKFPRAILEIEGGVLLTTFDRLQDGYADGVRAVFDFDGEPNSFSVRNPYGRPGDRLWVREAWAQGVSYTPALRRVAYRASEPDLDATWKPSIHMPRSAARLTLEITDVRVERVQEISHTDAIAEGVERRGSFWLGATHPIKGMAQVFGSPTQAFADRWNALNAKRGYGWDANPWVWAITFRRALAGAERP